MTRTIVVGAGSAGSVLAARLSEDPAREVLLLEAGPATVPPELLDGGSLRGADPAGPYNWAYPAALSATVDWRLTQGRVLGGSSTINGGYFVDAPDADFERWAAAGNPAWAASEVAPYRARVMIPAVTAPQDHPVSVAFAAAAREAGLGRPAAVRTTVIDGVRMNTATAYLDPVAERPNLEVRGGSTVRRILTDGRRAVGVEVDTADGALVVAADDIVVSAGGIGSAHLLLRSGIGPADDLRWHGVEVVADLPVGIGFSDHPQVGVEWMPSVSLPLGRILASAIRTPTAELLPLLAPTARLFDGPDGGPLAALVSLRAARSRGTISLSSDDWAAPPRIDYRGLQHPDDRAGLRTAVRLAAALLGTRAFAPIVERIVDLDGGVLALDARLDEWIEVHLATAFHLCGSVPMGPVVDQAGRVHGIDRLRVADCSILPTVPTVGPAATAVLLAERLAPLIP